MTESKNSSKAFKPFKSLTLLNETGNVEIYRVSEETRKKVEEDTRRINQQNVDLYHKSRKMIKRKEHQKLKMHNDNVEAMRLRWVQKMANSPFNVNQLEKEEKRRTYAEERDRQREVDKWRSKLVLNMTGKAALGISNREREKSLDHQQRLALSLRKTINDDKQINAEKHILNHMLLEEISTIKKKLPNLPVPEDLFGDEIQEDAKLLELSDHSLMKEFLNKTKKRHPTSSPSRHRRGSTSRSISPSSSLPRTQMTQKTNSGGANSLPSSARPIDSERSIETTDSSGIYHAPLATMQTLENELGQMSLGDFR